MLALVARVEHLNDNTRWAFWRYQDCLLEMTRNIFNGFKCGVRGTRHAIIQRCIMMTNAFLYARKHLNMTQDLFCILLSS